MVSVYRGNYVHPIFWVYDLSVSRLSVGLATRQKGLEVRGDMSTLLAQDDLAGDVRF